MPVRQLTPTQEVEAYLQQELEKRKQALLNALAYAGERCLANMRDTGNYIDRSGNLRSSTGYAIVVDGKVWTKSDFKQEAAKGKQPPDHKFDGSSQGETYLLEVIKNFPQGIVLVLVAGMNYARYVADKGYNVLDSAENLAERLVPQLLTRLGFIKR